MGKRRYFQRMPRDGEMRVYFGYYTDCGSVEGPDLIYNRGNGVSKRCGHLLHFYFNPYGTGIDGKPILPLHKALEEAGFDLSTLRFSIRKKAVPEGHHQGPSDA